MKKHNQQSDKSVYGSTRLKGCSPRAEKRKIWCLILLSAFFFKVHSQHNIPQYYATVADKEHYSWLLSLIGSIHKTNFAQLKEIGVYDIGLTAAQVNQLERMKKVSVYSIARVHPDLLKKFKTRFYGKYVRGWYAWKPVAIKQALERYPYMLYLDAGCLVLKRLDTLFEYIKEHDYFLISNNHTLREWTTKFVIEQFNLKDPKRTWVLDSLCMTAGVQGLTRNMIASYVLPMYEFAKDLRYFADDGTALNGFGGARHDQCVFTIQARLLGLKVFDQLCKKGGVIPLKIGGKNVPFYTTWDKHWQDNNTQLLIQNKGRLNFAKFIQYR